MIREFKDKYYFLNNFYKVLKFEAVNSRGQNNLDKILMRVREEL